MVLVDHPDGSDEIPDLVNRIIDRRIDGQPSGGWGIVQSYNEATHRASVLLQDTNILTGELQISSSFIGSAHPLRRGDKVWVGMIAGIAQIVLGVVYGDNDPVPTATTVFNGDVGIVGALLPSVIQFQNQIGLALPPAVAANRGLMVFIQFQDDGVAGTADGLYILKQLSTGALSWVQIA